MRVKQKHNPRIIFLIAIMLSVFCVFGFRAADFQLVTADEFASQNAGLTSIDTKITATRGVIVDRYGRPIAANRDGYNIVFNSAYMKSNNYNSNIHALCKLLMMYNTEWNDVLPLEKAESYNFTEDMSAVAQMKTKLGLNDYASAENCFDEMVSRYSLQAFTKDEQRIIMGVRYSMEKADFSVSYPFTFANDISSQLMMVVSETYSHLEGVEIEVVTYREYADPELAVHILGTTGKMTAEEWEIFKLSGYSYDDIVGKSGVEKAFEEYLRGTDGTMTYYFDKSGKVARTEVKSQPVQGNTVFLTIDSKLQKVAQNALADNIKKLNSQGSRITGGAVVVTSVKTGEVLASANYPTYSLVDYYKDYSAVQSADNAPLYDRAFRGLYPPGSAFKPLVAVAGLEEGIINRQSTVYCNKKYTFYEDYQPNCMHKHGYMNVITAISKSCNCFFFDTGRQLGITKLNDYTRLFGLGVKTGVEITESVGTVAGPQYSSTVGSVWYAGMTLSAAIGQSDNAFTPLQLSAYTATVANGGTRYKTTLLNSVRSATTNELLYYTSPVVMETVSASSSVMSIVKEGMHSVTSEGTASAYFADYPISVGGKTGTAQTTGLDNSVLTIFAPYDDPEIAISIVVEHGQKSYSTGPVAKAILDEYFFGSAEDYDEKFPNTLLD